MSQENGEMEEAPLRYVFSLVIQGNFRFYSLTIPSDVLTRTCYVTTREEDPKTGFQRTLDQKRAQEIADYIDSGLGTIPNSIVLSAQNTADLKIIKAGKILEFFANPKAFLVLDGQHRVYGFSLAKSILRVPVVIYNGLTRQQESRLFIDINTKQRPVPNELLLDIKSLAELETDTEQLLREIFDLFNDETDSPLLGMLSSASKSTSKLTRVTFNAAFKPLLTAFQDKEIEEIYEITRSYIQAFILGMNSLNVESCITKPIVFRAIMQLFNEIAQRVKYRYDTKYTSENFYEILAPIFQTASSAWFNGSKVTINGLYKRLLGAVNISFRL